jgi:hypothetical protein
LEIGPSGQAQGFILPATYEYCVDGLRMAEEAFSRAEAEAAPARTDRLTFSGKTPVAAACQVTLGRKRGGYLAQPHAAGTPQHPGELKVRPAATAFACSGLLAVTRGPELGD